MNFITKNYPIGAEIQAPHPANPHNSQCVICNHTQDNITLRSGPTGIMVQFSDGVYMEIERGYLNEDGGGIV